MKHAILSVLAAALLTAVAAAPAAAAGTFQASIAVTAVGTQGDPSDAVAVTAQATVAQQCDPTTSCAYVPFVTSVAAAQQCSPALTSSTWVGDAYDHVAAQSPQVLSPTWREFPAQQSGDRRACLYVRTSVAGRLTDVLVAEAHFAVAPPIRLPPGAGVPRAPIPRSVGVRRGFGFRLSLAAIPNGVDRTRFSLIARVAARRWGLRLAGRLGRVARSGDGVDSVGFSPGVPSYALGVTSIRSVRWFRRVNGRARLVRQRVVERDTRFATGVPWHAGPGDPPVDRVDLQTVVIHELGHYAGNGHVRNCRNSPMWIALRPGEWWHDRGDWFQFGCGRGTGTARSAAAPAPARPLLHEHVYRDVFVD
jgi:hypothetical protein